MFFKNRTKITPEIESSTMVKDIFAECYEINQHNLGMCLDNIINQWEFKEITQKELDILKEKLKGVYKIRDENNSIRYYQVYYGDIKEVSLNFDIESKLEKNAILRKAIIDIAFKDTMINTPTDKDKFILFIPNKDLIYYFRTNRYESCLYDFFKKIFINFDILPTCVTKSFVLCTNRSYEVDLTWDNC